MEGDSANDVTNRRHEDGVAPVDQRGVRLQDRIDELFALANRGHLPGLTSMTTTRLSPSWILRAVAARRRARFSESPALPVL